ncbi:MAG: PHP domain-containing protein [Planctomycetes bacterium]|nr:PHP domain-containing protein [Planctomycetota bacterium]
MAEHLGVVDLHSHSTCSDGTLTPSELVAEAARRGVAVLALTDHDTVAGLAEAAEAALQHGIELVRGIEVTCDCQGMEVHMLGLGVNPGSGDLQALCKLILSRRRLRFNEMIERLRMVGAPLSVPETADGMALARPFVARLLVQQGFVESYTEAFDRYLKRGCPGYVEHNRISMAQAIAAIHAGSGLAFVAHPGLNPRGDDVVYEARQFGLDGIECWHSDHTHDVQNHYRAMAQKFDMLCSGGADFHGLDHPRSKHFGQRGCPSAELDRIRARLQRAGVERRSEQSLHDLASKSALHNV